MDDTSRMTYCGEDPNKVSMPAEASGTSFTSSLRSFSPVKSSTEQPKRLSCRGTSPNHSSTGIQTRQPYWLPALLRTDFFVPCAKHPNERKNECIFFCVEPEGKADAEPRISAMCDHCLAEVSSVPDRTVLQIRRYVYCNVVRSADLQRYMDIRGIQNYIANSTKVVFLEARPQSKSFKPNSTERCGPCGRYLREGCRFCSVSCKMQGTSQANTSSSPEQSSDTCQPLLEREGDTCGASLPGHVRCPPHRRPLALYSAVPGSGSGSSGFTAYSNPGHPTKRRKQLYPRQSPSS